ncbi:MAG: hypothetical protein KatS3mg103_1124 [Phycisphaerales bacterium]|nr:MAG: hypothetical protein KatS3mg103_1124 [Phycisphaerales bacterium]
MKTSTLWLAGLFLTLGAGGTLGLNAVRPADSLGGRTPGIEAGLPAASTASATRYEIDGVHSGVVFRIMHAGAAPFYGLIPGLSGSLTFDPQNPEATSVDVRIETANIMTGNGSRDDHLRSADFFNVRQFPTSTYTATGAKALEGGAFELDGRLTLLGKTLPVKATITPTGKGTFRNQPRAGFEATMRFNRSDFGMTTYVQEGTLGDEVPPDGLHRGRRAVRITRSPSLHAATTATG